MAPTQPKTKIAHAEPEAVTKVGGKRKQALQFSDEESEGGREEEIGERRYLGEESRESGQETARGGPGLPVVK